MSTQPAAPAAPPESTLDHQPSRERTPWLLGCLCFLIPVLPADVVLAGPLKSNGSPARMIAIIMFGLVALGFVVVRRTSCDRRVNPGAIILLLYFLLWLLVYGVGLLSIDSPSIAANKTRAVIVLIANVGVGLFALTMARTARQRRIVLGCLLAGLAFACLVGLLQSVSSVDLRLLFKPPGFVLHVEEGLGSKRMGVQRVMGTSQHPIEFSALAAVTIPLAIYFARNAATRNVRFLSLAACGLATLALPAAVSRTGVISVAAALLLYAFAFKVRQIIVTAAAGAIMIGGYIIVFPHIANALWNTITGSQADPSVQSRTEHYLEVSRIFGAHTVFGLGLGGAPQFYDNEWLQTIVQGGVIGVAALILLCGGTAFGVSAALRRATTPTQREQAYMLGAVAVGILLSSTTFDLLYYQQATLVFFIAFGLLWGPFTIPAPESQHHRLDRLLSSCSHVTFPTFPRKARRRAASAMPR
jgi:polysaccharide biosynthesis protein PslJ